MKWNAVTECMPPTLVDAEGFPGSKDVLVFFTDGDFGIAHASIFDEETEWYSADSGDNVTRYVSHWMDLPAAPKALLGGAA